MFTKTLSKNTEKALALLGNSHLLDKAYLAGGTACALHIGHRISIDLDFFTPQEFNAQELIQALSKFGKFELDQQSWGTVLGLFASVKFSIFVYQYPVLFPTHSFEGVQVLDLRDIAAMKIDAINTRGIKRDFVDLYFICQQSIALKDALSYYGKKYGTLASNRLHIQKSLAYFVDAEITQMPKMLNRITWKKIKSYFEHETKKLAMQH